jgi:hypothetical protein
MWRLALDGALGFAAIAAIILVLMLLFLWLFGDPPD